jgi:hypothetical protein
MVGTDRRSYSLPFLPPSFPPSLPPSLLTICANVTAHKAGLWIKSLHGTLVRLSQIFRKAPLTSSTPS